MLSWSFKKLSLFWGLVAVAPITVLMLAAWFWGEAISHWICGLGLVAAAAGVWAGAWFWHHRLNRQVEMLLEYSRALTRGDPRLLAELSRKFSQLGPLGAAIGSLRDDLVEYLSLYRRFFESAPDMFLSISPKTGYILDANQSFCRALGKLRSEVVNQPVEDFITMDKPWDQILAGEEGTFSGQISTDQGIIKVEASTFWEQGTGTQPWVLAASMRDVTQKEALVRELLSKSAALEKALVDIKSVEDLKDQFLTNLSHELKTPLVSLKGFLQLLKNGRVPPEDTSECLEICWRNLRKLETQIEDLLDLARLSQNKDQYDMGPVEIGALVRTEAENLQPVAAERQVRLDVSGLADNNITVMGNQEKLVQLVDNLVLNALKTKTGGESLEEALIF